MYDTFVGCERTRTISGEQQQSNSATTPGTTLKQEKFSTPTSVSSQGMPKRRLKRIATKQCTTCIWCCLAPLCLCLFLRSLCISPPPSCRSGYQYHTILSRLIDVSMYSPCPLARLHRRPPTLAGCAPPRKPKFYAVVSRMYLIPCVENNRCALYGAPAKKGVENMKILCNYTV